MINSSSQLLFIKNKYSRQSNLFLTKTKNLVIKLYIYIIIKHNFVRKKIIRDN